MNLQRVVLEVENHSLHAWVARSDEERELGLMHCRNLGDREGMLFMCDAPAVQSFWMKDTPLALSAAFMDDDGTILHVADLEPFTLDGHSCPHPVRYVLEVPRGWFAERGIGTGARIAGPMFVPARAG